MQHTYASVGPQPLLSLQILLDLTQKKEGGQGSKERSFQIDQLPKVDYFYFTKNDYISPTSPVRSAAEKQYALALSVKEPILLLI